MPKPNGYLVFIVRLVNEGFYNVLNSMSRMTFWRYLALLTDIGISKSQLKNHRTAIGYYRLVYTMVLQYVNRWL
ncbi:MAG: phage/plasmid replication protein, II/X family [Candidatus Arsenophonus phytopathogenicus]